MKRTIEMLGKPSPMDPNLIAAYNRGKDFADRENKEELKIKLATLEDIPGVGDKMSQKIAEHFISLLNRQS